ncbi:MAG: nitroreductase family protein, partial [Vicinamibacterales bacterium]
FERNGAANRYAHHDAGMALANLLLQATALGLAARPMGGFDVEATRAACRVPAGFDPVSVTALGYPASPDLLDADLRARELATRERLPIHQLVFAGTWGQEL